MGKPRDEAERESDRRNISDLYLQGWNQTEIGDKLGIDQSTVSRDIKTLKAEWRKQRNGLVEEFEAKYRLMYKEAYAAWLRSKEDAETTTQEAIEGDAVKLDREGNPIPGKQRLKVSTRREGQSGNPALLAQAQAALKAIREMFGVDAAQKLEHSGSIDLSFESSLKKAYNGHSTGSGYDDGHIDDTH